MFSRTVFSSYTYDLFSIKGIERKLVVFVKVIQNMPYLNNPTYMIVILKEDNLDSPD